jgi:2-methylcitrate dehydratase PrpD
LAALMAMEGCTAHQDVLGDSLGFGHTFYADEYAADKITAEFASPYSIIYPGMAVKIYPCCGLTHCPLDIALDLVRAHDIQPHQIEDVVVYTEELVPSVLIHHEPKTGYQGKYSLEYAVAAAIFDRKISFDTFTDDEVNRPQLQAFLGKIRCNVRPDSEWAPTRIHPWNHCAEITIRLNDGTEITGSEPCARGYPDRLLSTEEIVNKYRQFASTVLTADAVAALGDRTLKLEEQENIAEVIRLARAYSK